jgi:surface antigen
MTNKRLHLSIAAAAILTFSGLGVNIKTASIEMMPAVAQSCIRNENFSLVVASTNGITLRSDRNLNARTGESVAFNQTVDFDAWAYGEEITDLWGSRDALWFKLRGRNLWVPSGYMKGFPPSRPSARPNGTPTCDTSTPNPSTNNPPNFRSVNFSGTAHRDGVNIRSAPTTNSSIVGRLQPNQQANFDGWTHSDVIPDAWTNQPDARWYRIPGQGWVASAAINGNAPGSVAMPGGDGVTGAGNQNAERFFSWANGQRGISRYDLGSEYNGQCVTLIARYVQDVFLPANERRASRAYGDGKDTASVLASVAPFNRYFGGFTRSGAPNRGAVISFAATRNNQYGHVAVVMEVQGRRARLLESNADVRNTNSTVTNSRWINLDAGDVRGWTNPR